MKFLLAAAVFLNVFSVWAASSPDDKIQACFKAWGTHPFDKAKPKYRTIKSKVKVMGSGTVVDDKVTKTPELVVIEPSVAVMGSNKYKLLNPNGWYCMRGRVAVMGSTGIQVDCRAHLASSQEGAAVMGSNDSETGGVAVMGSVKVTRVGDCAEKAATE